MSLLVAYALALSACSAPQADLWAESRAKRGTDAIRAPAARQDADTTVERAFEALALHHAGTTSSLPSGAAGGALRADETDEQRAARYARISAYAREQMFLQYGRLPDDHPVTVYAREALAEALGPLAQDHAVYVLPEWRDINAMILPDGSILLSAGEVQFCRYREELKATVAHEAIHFRRRHVKQREELATSLEHVLTSQTSLTRVAQELLRMVGLQRGQEYEADLRWMFGEWKVNVNPLAQVLYFERLEEFMSQPGRRTAADLAHGSDADRALNTQSVFYLFDLDTLSHELGGEIPQALKDSLSAMPYAQVYVAGDVPTFLQEEAYEQAQAARLAAVQRLPATQLGLALSAIFERLKENNDEARKAVNRALLAQLAQRVDEELLPASAWPDAKRRSVARTLFYELHAGINWLGLDKEPELKRFAAVEALDRRRKEDAAQLATLEDVKLLGEMLNSSRFQALPLPPIAVSPTELVRRVAAAAINSSRLKTHPAAKTINQYTAAMAALSASLRRLYAAQGVEPRAAEAAFETAMQALAAALPKAGRWQALARRSARAADRAEGIISGKEVSATAGLPTEEVPRAEPAEKEARPKASPQDERLAVQVVEHLWQRVAIGKPYQAADYQDLFSRLQRHLRRRRAEEVLRMFDDIARQNYSETSAVAQELATKTVGRGGSRDFVNEQIRLEIPQALRAYALFRLFEQAVATWPQFSALPAAVKRAYVLRGLVQLLYASVAPLGHSVALRLDDARGSRLVMSEVDENKEPDDFFTLISLEDSLEDSRTESALAQSDRAHLDTHLNAIESAWLTPEWDDAALAAVCPILYSDPALDYFLIIEPGTITKPIFAKMAAARLAQCDSWSAFFSLTDHLEALGVPVGKLIAEHSRLFGQTLARLWQTMPAQPTPEELDQLKRAVAWVNDPFLRLQLESYYYERRWPTMSFEQKLEALCDPARSSPVDLRRFNAFIETEARTQAQLDAVRAKLKASLDAFLSAGSSGLGFAALFSNMTLEQQSWHAFLLALLETWQADAPLKALLYDAMREWKGEVRMMDSDMDDQEAIAFAQRMAQQADEVEAKLFRMDAGAKYALLRKLLTGPAGLVAQPKQRRKFLAQMIRQTVTTGAEPALERIVSDVVTAASAVEAWKPLYFALQPLLADRIAIPPERLSGWDDILAGRLELEDPERLDAQLKGRHAGTLEEMRERAARQEPHPWRHEADWLRYSEELLRAQLVSRGMAAAGNGHLLSPLSFVVEVAQHLGAVGVRFLQLLPQFAELPPEEQEAFSKVYDAVVGQSKLAAVALLEREWPQLWEEMDSLEPREGGGSLMTVYRAKTKDGRDEVVKVLNPNLEFLLEDHARYIEEIVEALERAFGKKYAIARLVLADVKEWIKRDVNFQGFLEQDAAFRAQNDGFTLPAFRYRMMVPRSIGPASRFFMREDYVPGENLTQWDALEQAGHDMKQVISLITKHYIEQLRRGVCHSDVHVGNFRVTPDDRIAILDRNFFLHLSPAMQAVADALLNPLALWGEPPEAFITKLVAISETPVNAAQRAALASAWQTAREEIARGEWQRISGFLVELRRQGLTLPIEVTLVFKNLNSLQQMARRAGFASLIEAYLYTPPPPPRDAQTTNPPRALLEPARSAAEPVAMAHPAQRSPLGSLFLLRADYGFLSEKHIAVQFARRRLAALLPDVPSEDVPPVEVLASTGFGINAVMFANGTMVLSPEMAQFCETAEEFDGVLMHELNHWTRKHHELLAKSARGGAILRSLGAQRWAEYEADLRAFYQMAEPQRRTNPRGITRLLERLRDEERKAPDRRRRISWDVAHGSLTDLILNLKIATRLLDFLHLDRDLTPIDPALAQSLEGLPGGGRLSRLLAEPPAESQRQEYTWEREVANLLDHAEWPLLQAAIEPLYARVKELSRLASTRALMSHEASRRDAAAQLLRRVLTRWEKLVDQAFAGAAPPDRALLRVVLLEAGAGIPIVSDPDDAVARLPIFSSARQAFQTPRPGPGLLPALTSLLSRDGARLPLDPSQLGRLLAWAAHEALGPRAEYDEAEGINVPRYLQEAAAVSRAAEELLSNGTADAAADDAATAGHWSAEDVWTSATIGGALILADVDEWARWQPRYAQLIHDASPLAIAPDRISRLLNDYAKRHPARAELARAVEAYARTQWVLPLTLQQTIARLNEVLLTLLRESRQRPLVYTNPTHAALLKEAGRLLHALPPEISPDGFAKELVSGLIFGAAGQKRVERDRLIRRMAIGGTMFEEAPNLFHQASSGDELLTAVAWIRAMAPDEAAFTDWLTTIGYAVEERLAASLEELEDLARAVREPQRAEAIAGVAPRLRESEVRLTRIGEWQGRALEALAARLESEPVATAEDYFRQLEAFLRVWPVGSSIDKEGNYIATITDLKRTIVERALAFLQPAFNGAPPTAAAAPPMAVDALRRLLIASFFFDDAIIKRRVQDYALTSLISALSLEGAIQLLARDFSTQGLLGSLRTLERLDEKARTPEALARLKEAGRERLTQGGALADMGKAVLADGAMEYLFDQTDRLPMALALLTSARNEARLRNVLANGWWELYGHNIREDLRKSLDDVTRMDELATWASRPPILLQDRRFENQQATLRFYALQEVLEAVYRLGPAERYVLLRKLLSDERGVLSDQKGRRALLEQFFTTYVAAEADPAMVALMREVFAALFDAAPADELYLTLEPLLSPRIGNPPPQPGSWAPDADWFAERLIDAEPSPIPAPLWEEMEAMAEKKRQYGEVVTRVAKKQLAPALQTWLLSFMNGYAPGQTPQPGPEERALRLVPPEFLARQVEALSPLALVVDTARRLGAPGVRFLQLLGQTVPIPAAYREEFLTVYDSIKGQTTLSAWETIQRELPDYAKRVKTIERIGGGSLMTVYKVELDDGSVEAVRVLNPNAWYHAQISLRIIRDALEQLVATDKTYARAMPLLSLLEQWIQQELDDPTYDGDDASFYQAWNDWQPSGFTARVMIPRNIPTGTKYVRREQFVPGANFTALDSFAPAQQKELAALAAQHYVAQIMRGQVHSDVSPGNVRRGEDGNLIILDRGMSLKITAQEQLLLWQLGQAGTPAARAEALVRWLWSLPENTTRTHRRKVEPALRRIAAKLHQTRAADPEDAMLNILVAVHEEGLRVPLKFSLLFKNLNVLHRFAKQAGFVSLAEALAYRPPPPPTEPVRFPPAPEAPNPVTTGLSDAVRSAGASAGKL